MPNFNLLDERWLPCTWLADDRHENLSIREVLARAHTIREPYDPSPLVTVALHRLLLAILHRNFGPRNLDAWCVLWQRGQWDMAVLDEYFAAWRHRFDLFDAERPFYQVRFTDNTESHDMTFLVPEFVYGNSSSLFDRRVHEQVADSAHTSTPARAAHLLLVRQAYSIGFGKSQPFYFQDGPLTRGFTVLAQGSTLFETLMLNLIRYDEYQPLPLVGKDLPQWEQEVPAEPDHQGTIPAGYLDYLTWQSRRIELIPTDDGTEVVGCKVRQNLRLSEGLRDPFKSYRKDDLRGVVARSLRPERAVWRDSQALFADWDPPFGRPELFRWLAQVYGAAHQGRIVAQERYAFGVLGFTTEEGQAANIVLWRQDRLPLPLRYLEERLLWEELDSALGKAEQVARVLGNAIETLAALIIAPEADREKDGLAKVKREKQTKQRITKLVESWSPLRRYWAQLEPPFLALLSALPDDRMLDEEEDWQYGAQTIPRWQEEIERAARRAFRETALGSGSSGRTLKAIAWAEKELGYGLRRIIGAGEKAASYKSAVIAEEEA